MSRRSSKAPARRMARALRSLYARASRGIQLGLAPMEEACARFDHPERAFPAVHVTGTNGKGSVCAMLQEVALAAGLRTGMYTSPHLTRYAERIRLNGVPIESAALLDLLDEVDARAPELTFFEATTLLAFLAFRAAKVDLAIVEVGIGGRLDATNVLPAPLAAAITRVAFDHTEYLGDTLDLIAREKAGIAKPGTPLVLGPLPADLRAAVIEVASARGARIVRSDDEAAAASIAALGLDLTADERPGSYQADNRRVALLVARELQARGIAAVNDRAIRTGIARARWPGRLELLTAHGHRWLLDAAHNLDGAEALARTLAGGAGERIGALVFGALADKKWPEMIDVLAPLVPAARRIYAPPSSGLASRPAASPHLVAQRHRGAAASSVAQALDLASSVAAGGTIVVCGSIFLLGEARALLLDLPRDPPLAL